jgi:hypothetical protein
MCSTLPVYQSWPQHGLRVCVSGCVLCVFKHVCVRACVCVITCLGAGVCLPASSRAALCKAVS